ncbi:MAG TPA: FMN-binding protein [Clostridiales bacterium]|jgi:electron transport complex protein RnfG|nr:FMN-binding protein [Clostridiales bacterium]
MPDVLKKNKTLFQSVKMVLVLFLTTALTAGVLSSVNSLTKDKIEENLGGEIRKSFVEMFGEGIEYQALGDLPAGAEAIYEITYNGKTYYCVSVNSSGFGGDINILATFDKGGRIAGVSVVSHSETPGIGTNVFEDSYLAKFRGKATADEVDAISGATVSSKALKSGISTAFDILAGAGMISSGGEGK